APMQNLAHSASFDSEDKDAPYLTTAATMIAFVNAIVAAAGVALLALGVGADLLLALCLGIGTITGLMTIFYLYQRLRTKGMVRIAKPYGSEKSVL
ncbi:hypothetical protein ACWGTO_29080, partial [Mesorhizobium sp. PL10]